MQEQCGIFRCPGSPGQYEDAAFALHRVAPAAQQPLDFLFPADQRCESRLMTRFEAAFRLDGPDDTPGTQGAETTP